MSSASSDLHIEGFVGRAFGDDNTSFEGVIKDDAICNVPWRAVKICRATEASFFLDGEEHNQGRVGQLQSNYASHDLEYDGNTGGVVSAKVGGAITIEDAIAQNWLVTKARGYAIHVRVKQERHPFPGKGGYEVAGRINLSIESKGGKVLHQVGTNVLFVT